MKRRLMLSLGTALAILALMLCLLLVCCLRYAKLYSALRQSGGMHMTSYALVYGGVMDDAALVRAQERLGAGISVKRGDDGRVYGSFAAGNPLSGAVKELRLRCVLGGAARTDRWARASMEACCADELESRADSLLSKMGDIALSRYVGEQAASVRGKRYHVAARENECIIGADYIPIDY